MKFCLIFYLFFITGTADASARQPSLPNTYQLDSLADFKKYQPNVIGCIQWLAQTPRNNADKRTETEDFLISWISGCPYINVIIEPYIMKLARKNADLVVSFMFGYTLFALQNPGNKDLITANVAGLENFLNDYRINSKLFKKDANIDQLLNLQKAGTLSVWVEPQLKQKLIK